MNNDFTDYVYLSELDSVKSSYEDQIKGEEVLFNALVYEGKAVVLTYNQIVDSVIFLHCIHNEESFKTLLSYFKDKRLLVNQYQENMNLSKYIQQNYDPNSSFRSTYFSFLNKYPRIYQNVIFQGICDSIRYGDTLYARKTMPKDILEEDKSSICQYIAFILTINAYMGKYKSYVKPRPKEELVNHQMVDYMKKILYYLKNIDSPYANIFRNFIILHYSKQRGDTRSDYLLTLEELIPIQYQYIIKEFIHLAYNQALEYSIPIIHREDHLEKDLNEILKNNKIDFNENIAPTICHWNVGYRMTSLAAMIYKKVHIDWKYILWTCPFIEALRIITSLIVAFIAMVFVQYLSFIENMWQSYSTALLITFIYNLALDGIQDFIIGFMPEWFYKSNVIKQGKNVIMDLHVLMKGMRL
ncbi:hypothetical protein KEC48_15850 [Clostridium sp. C1]|uniref:hypothetical protein n=1 Tax=Clostridium sp. C1 TaxID=1155388 RepID=UPI001BA553DE|nr:hypothetical protein [Clostridium sp. C1]QUN12915.1 hypothetical protein KEC48_15850 [Clostridium sp. C1]